MKTFTFIHKQMRLLTLAILALLAAGIHAQELNCTVKVNHSQVQGTSNSVFNTLEEALNDFMNNHSWTELQFNKDERIVCTMTITVSKYDESTHHFTGNLLFQLTRPVFNASYSTTVFSMRDPSFNFYYQEHEPLEFNETSMDNNLTAMMAYYAYLFIGLDLDTFAPLGGTEVLHKVENIVNNAQSIADAGWQAFNDDRNRHAIINDYMESSMEQMRQMMYKYHREGLDEMAQNADRGRAAITEAIELVQEAHNNKTMSTLPQIFTDYKRDEIINIYRGHGTDNERNSVYEILSKLNASQSREWDKIKK